MEIQVGKWGDSLVVRIPLARVRALQLAEGDPFELPLAEGRMVLAPARPRYDLEELVSGITPENRHSEVDWGDPEGAESWRTSPVE